MAIIILGQSERISELQRRNKELEAIVYFRVVDIHDI